MAYVNVNISDEWLVQLDFVILDYYNKEPISFKPSESFIVQKSLRKNKPIVFNKSLFRTFRYIPEYIWPKFEWIFSLKHLVKDELKHLKNYAKNRSRDMNLSLQDIKTVQKRVKLISKKAKKCTFLYPLCIGGVKSHYYYQDVKNVLHKHVLNLSPMWFESKDKKNGTRQIEIKYTLQFFNCILNYTQNNYATPCEYSNFIEKIEINKQTPLFHFLTFYTIRLDITSPSRFHALSEEIKEFLLYTAYALDPLKFSVLDEFSCVRLNLLGHDNVLIKDPRLYNYKFGNFFIIPRTQLLATLFVLRSDYHLVCGQRHYSYLTRWCKTLLRRIEKIGLKKYLRQKEKFMISNGILTKEQFLELVSLLVQKDKPVGKYDLKCLQTWRCLIADNLNVTIAYSYPAQNKRTDRSDQCKRAIIKGIKVLRDRFSVVSKIYIPKLNGRLYFF